MERTDLRFLGRRVTGEDLTMIQEIVASCAGLTRMELARTVCELLGWRRRSERLKARECREFLEKLDASGLLVLPDKRAGRPVGSRTEVPETERGNPGAVVAGTAHDVGRLELELVRTDEERRLFRELVGRYHYLGHAVPFGAHLRYLISGCLPEKTVLGAAFSFPARHGGSPCGMSGSDGTRRRGCAICSTWSTTAASSCCLGSS